MSIPVTDADRRRAQEIHDQLKKDRELDETEQQRKGDREMAAWDKRRGRIYTNGGW
jgi:hypothetical protein